MRGGGGTVCWVEERAHPECHQIHIGIAVTHTQRDNANLGEHGVLISHRSVGSAQIRAPNGNGILHGGSRRIRVRLVRLATKDTGPSCTARLSSRILLRHVEGGHSSRIGPVHYSIPGDGGVSGPIIGVLGHGSGGINAPTYGQFRIRGEPAIVRITRVGTMGHWLGSVTLDPKSGTMVDAADHDHDRH
jgi:hypothetical protein